MIKYIDLGKRAINPDALIKMATEGANAQADSESLEAKKAADKADADSKKAKDDTLPNRTKTAKDNINKLLEDKTPIVEKKAAEKTDDVDLGETASEIKLRMGTDAVNDKAAEEANASQETEPIIKVAKGLLDVNHEKMAAAVAKAGRLAFLGKAKSPALIGLGLTASGAGGYGIGAHRGKKRLRRYISADRRRDVQVTNFAYRKGQVAAYNRMKNRLGQA
jgi:hypothetical protein